MNDLGITKAEARAALRAIGTAPDDWNISVQGSVERIGWTVGGVDSWFDSREALSLPNLHADLALALIATIGGAVDGKGKPK